MEPVRARGAPLGAVALLLGLAFAAFFAAISRGVFLYGDDVLMFQVTESLVERGELTVTSTAPARTNAHAIVGADGRRYAKYGIGLSAVAVPFVALGRTAPFRALELPETRDAEGNPRAGRGPFAAGLTNAAVAGALAAILFGLARTADSSPFPSLAVALLGVFATPVAHYAAGFLSEPLSALCLAGALAGIAIFALLTLIQHLTLRRWHESALDRDS